VANCGSCHGVHNILPRSDPRSTVHPQNLGRTCGTCHPGAGERFALGPVHVKAGSASEHPMAHAVRLAYLVIIPLTLGFMLLHNGMDFARKLMAHPEPRPAGPELPRMGLHFRVAHGLTLVSFVALVVTGFALKFPEALWAQPLLALEGRFAFRGLVHRMAGVLLLTALAYHGLHLARSRSDRRLMRRILPRWSDLADLLRALAWNAGLAAEPPRFGMFS